MNEFTFFAGGVYNTKDGRITTLPVIVDIIRTSLSLKKQIGSLRSCANEKARKKIKESLPYCVFSGICEERNNDSVKELSSLVCIDLDHLGTNGEIQKAKDKILSCYTPALMFTSPSGDGLKIVSQVDLSKGTYEGYYDSLCDYYVNVVEIPVKVIDDQTSDISHPCSLSYDPDCFYSDNPAVLNMQILDQPIVMVSDDSLEKKYARYRKEAIPYKEGNRHNHCTQVACKCHGGELPEDTVLQWMLNDYDLDEKEITSIVKTVYKNHKYESPIPEPDTYIRIGTDYFKILYKKDRYGISRRELKHWKKDTLVTDYGRKYPKKVPRFDDFIMAPDNINYQPVIGNFYNCYAPFCHTPAPGQWIWTERLLRHIFGEQYELGIRYMQLLYCYPKRATVILVLVSRERAKGKTTFVNWISMLFGSNTSIVSSKDFEGVFNSAYATKNIVMIEETLFDRKLTIEKLKSLATQKQLSVNQKWVDPFSIDFYCKIILTSNYEDKFALIDKEETRFFVRKLGTPEFRNITIEDDLLNEIPAFLYYLKNLIPVSTDISRSGFTAEELRNEFLNATMQESEHADTKELRILIADYFDRHPEMDRFYASAIDLKNTFFPSDNKTSCAWIMRLLKDDFSMIPDKIRRYTPFDGTSKTGRPYLFWRKDFTEDATETIPY